MINFKVGIIGAGKIAGTIADTLNQLDAFEPYAIASRDIDKANEFADKYSIEKRYGSYQEIMQDEDVELIYIATPHSNHAELAKQCLEAGKPCLVEKAFSYNAETAKEVMDLSEEKNIFCGEAMWIRYMPAYKFLCQNLKAGVIGEPQQVDCSLGYDIKDKERITSPELAGGALLDLGVYPIHLFAMIFERAPENIIASCMRYPSGVDAQSSITMTFPNGKVGTALVTSLYKADNSARIYGTKGYITIDNINCPEEIKVYTGDNKMIADLTVGDKQINGYEFEFLAARNAIITGKVETVELPHSETVRLLGICDGLRNAWKVEFPMENI
jgi:predicted dehydrogenase